MQAFYSDHFVLPLPQGHRFPMAKYRMLRNCLLEKLPSIQLLEPRAACRDELIRAHSADYIESILTGSVHEKTLKAIGFPWSKAMAERALRSVGATLDALDSALQYGSAVNLAGGTHHAKRDEGSGFCVFNDQAVAAFHYLSSSSQGRVLILDLDVHQGDGTAQICAGEGRVFTFSMHGERNFPFEKQISDLDVGLPDACEDDYYLAQLDHALRVVHSRFNPTVVLYLAGLDVHRSDRLGRLHLSDEGIARRDEIVLDWCAQRRLPIVMSMGGGYFNNLDELVALQTTSIARLSEYSDWWISCQNPANGS